jgi:hypothetical protein
MSWEVSSAPIGKQHRRSASCELEVDNAVSRLERGGDTVEGHPMSETLGVEASGESEVLRDPSVGGLRRSMDMGRFAHVAC